MKKKRLTLVDRYNTWFKQEKEKGHLPNLKDINEFFETEERNDEKEKTGLAKDLERVQ